MKTIVYQSLRNEMTSLFAASKNFEIGQYAVLVIVFNMLITEPNTVILIIKAITITAFIFMITRIVANLYYDATRLGAYILVAYEIYDMNQPFNIDKDDKFQYWILANRSSTFYILSNNKEGKYGFLTSLANFYIRQIVTSVFFWILANFFIIRNFISKPCICLEIFGVILFNIMVVLSVVIIFFDNKKSKDYGKEQINQWKNYCDKRKECDDSFLNQVYNKNQ